MICPKGQGDTVSKGVPLVHININYEDPSFEQDDIDRPTDVLSFALNEGEEDGYEGPDTALLGDIIISLEKVQEQADEYGHSFERELAYLTIHGMLHILGYDHMEPEDKAEMRKEEEFILQRLDYVRQGEEL